jgi:hypothetical protein
MGSEGSHWDNAVPYQAAFGLQNGLKAFLFGILYHLNSLLKRVSIL